MIPHAPVGPTDAEAAELAAGGWRPVGFERLWWRDPVNALVLMPWRRALELARRDRPARPDGGPR